MVSKRIGSTRGEEEEKEVDEQHSPLGELEEGDH